MTKRSFFKSIASIVATVALAPEIAFGRLRDMPSVSTSTVNRLWDDAPYEVGFLFNAEDYMGDCEWRTFDPKVQIFRREKRISD